MKLNLTIDLLRQLVKEPPASTVDIYDTHQPRLVLRVRPTGKHSYRVLLGRGRWYSLGSIDVIVSPALARTLAQARLGEYASGRDPRVLKRREQERTVQEYLTDIYAPWLAVHRRRGPETIARLKSILKSRMGSFALSGLSAWEVERWRTERRKHGLSTATINRDLAALRAMLSRAVEWGHLAQHPLRAVKALREDKTARLRYLSVDEEKRLRQTLEARDLLRRQERDSANAWRRARAYDEWPAYGEYTDNLRPMVILALDTGMRFGELCALRWADVQMDLAFLTVRGATAKNGTTRHIPLNAEALQVLRTWCPAEIDESSFVFSGRTDDPIVDIKTAWLPLVREQARIPNFRFHDLRHTFASKLVMAGVDLNTVRELLGHADIKMTLRYAHLAAEHKAAAVAKLVAP